MELSVRSSASLRFFSFDIFDVPSVALLGEARRTFFADALGDERPAAPPAAAGLASSAAKRARAPGEPRRLALELLLPPLSLLWSAAPRRGDFRALATRCRFVADADAAGEASAPRPGETRLSWLSRCFGTLRAEAGVLRFDADDAAAPALLPRGVDGSGAAFVLAWLRGDVRAFFATSPSRPAESSKMLGGASQIVSMIRVEYNGK